MMLKADVRRVIDETFDGFFDETTDEDFWALNPGDLDAWLLQMLQTMPGYGVPAEQERKDS